MHQLNKYIPCLNGVRAVAIIFVILSHLMRSVGYSRWFYNIISFTDLGIIGVRMFFILSGFLITHLLFEEYYKNGNISIRNFFLRRVFRIFPCFYFYLIVLFFLNTFELIQIDASAIFLALFYIQNLNVFQNGETFISSWFVIHSWSLSIEEQFYIIFPFFFKRIFRLKPKHLFQLTLFVLGSGVVFRSFNYSFPYMSRWIGGFFFMHFDFLFIGVMIAYLIRYHYETALTYFKFKKELIALFASLIIVLCAKFEFHSGYITLLSGTFILISISYLILYILLFPHSQLGKILEIPVLSYLGKLSYSLYVWQQLFIGSSHLWLKFSELTLYPLNILMTFACALFSFYVIEKPFLKIKNKFR